MNSENTKGFREMWNDTCLAADIPAISTDTAARLMAIVYVHGGSSEVFTYSEGLNADMRYIQEKYHISGGEVPDETISRLISEYSSELESYEEEQRLGGTTSGEPVCPIRMPDWAKKLMKDRYNITL